MRQFEVSTDGTTVWVNGSMGCLARFGRHAMEIAAPTVPFEDVTEAYYSTRWDTSRGAPGTFSKRDWQEFKKKVLDFHGFEIADEHMPQHLRDVAR